MQREVYIYDNVQIEVKPGKLVITLCIDNRKVNVRSLESGEEVFAQLEEQRIPATPLRLSLALRRRTYKQHKVQGDE